jgi:hypothetical protein
MRVLNCHSISKLHQKVIEFQTMVAQGRRMSYDRFEVIITQHWAQYHRHLTTQPFIRRLFALFDENGDGELDFAEFHLTLASLSHGRLEERLRFAFSCIDVDGRYVYVCVCLCMCVCVWRNLAVRWTVALCLWMTVRLLLCVAMGVLLIVLLCVVMNLLLVALLCAVVFLLKNVRGNAPLYTNIDDFTVSPSPSLPPFPPSLPPLPLPSPSY